MAGITQDKAAGQKIDAAHMNAVQDGVLQNSHNIMQLFLENYFAGKTPQYLGLFFDGFSDTTKGTFVGVSSNAVDLRLDPSSVVQEAGDGSDGDVTINATTTINQTAAKVNASAASAQKIVSVTNGDEVGFANGDKVIIINNRNATEANAGFYEINEVDVVAVGQLTMLNNLANTYVGDATDNATGNKAQVIKIPQYNSLTVTSGTLKAPAWDGLTGGVLCFLVKGTLTLSGGSIAMGAGNGYLGGGNGAGTWEIAQGESTTGKGINSSARNLRGGGGGGNVSNGGGGGGGYGAAGANGNGSSVGIGGLAYGVASLAQLYFGSGGGKNNASGSNTGSDGGDGAGIIYIIASKIERVGGSFQAVGGGGGAGVNAGCGGASGGSILLKANEVIFGTSGANASGGAGGGGVNTGGAGAVGRIAINSNATVSGTTLPAFSQTAAAITLVNGAGGTYTSNLQAFGTDMFTAKAWLRRIRNFNNLAATITAAATSLTITGDKTARYVNGDIIDVIVSTDEVAKRERVTINAAVTFGGGVTTINFTPAIIAAETYDRVERVQARLRLSFVASGAGDSFEQPVFDGSVDINGSGEVEDSYSLEKSTARRDLKVEVVLDRNDIAEACYAKHLGVTVIE